MSDDFTLGEVYKNTQNIVTGSEAKLQDMLTKLNSTTGGASAMSVGDMVQLQYQMSVYSIGASMESGLIKSLDDTMKGIVSKF